MGNPEHVDYLPVAQGPHITNAHTGKHKCRKGIVRRFAGLLACLTLAQVLYTASQYTRSSSSSVRIPLHAQESLEKCHALSLSPGPSPSFHGRSSSDRFVPGTPAVLVRNGKIWTGLNNGTEIIEGDVLLEDGIIKGVGHLGGLKDGEFEALRAAGKIEVTDANGAWITPGIVDNHSHLGVYSAPALSGASDGNSRKGTIQPWLRSLDGLNTHDDAYELSIAGGVTTAAVLPGSANGIGGQAFTIKLRKTAERSTTAMLVEPPYDINRTRSGEGFTPWRQMKHACGENPSRVYGNTRMDTFWAFREAYNKASLIKQKQDDFCAKAAAGEWTGLGEFPEDLQWEALVDVVRGRVKVQAHCYEAVDLDDLVRLTNEFQFPIAAVHHAHEAYLVPDVLKRAHGGPPAAAIFAVNGRYKRESYRGSEFAPRILAEAGIPVVLKSDHPVLNSRHLLFEAQQAHYYGLPPNLALASVTSTPAHVLGLDHRVGYVREGWDADLIVWDSHPLALGAAPSQVFIDGIAQLKNPFVVQKPAIFQNAPETPNFDKEAADALKYEGLPPLAPNATKADIVVFSNVRSVVLPGAEGVREAFTASADEEAGTAVVVDGRLACWGATAKCDTLIAATDDVQIVDLKGGSIAPGLTAFGSNLGLSEIQGEASTRDGYVYDPLHGNVPAAAGGNDALVRAVDGLQFGGRDELIAYRSGVTRAVVAPMSAGFLKGLGVSFSLGAPHKLAPGALVQSVTALHVQIAHVGAPSVSTQIAALRKYLLGLVPEDSDREVVRAFKDASKGVLPVVVHTHSADIIATIIGLKTEVEEAVGARLQITIAGATEAHILAKELAAAKVGVVVINSRPYPGTWETKDILPGPPLSKDNAIVKLLEAGVEVGVGQSGEWMARNARLDVGWAALESGGRISKEDAIALASTTLDKLLGAEVVAEDRDLVATAGGDLLALGSKVVGVISPVKASVELF
ncbi:carbohydrate esterase family 9 protein [Peniophora sp. CONT]|nr:carbohydrate esterase family 9 protein [Peniophora sp. CONT]